MKDFLLNTNGAAVIVNNDLSIGFSDLQHQEHILIGQKGCLKEFPDRGVGIENYLNDGEIDEMLNMVNVEFIKDGMQVRSIDFNELDGGLNYDANY